MMATSGWHFLVSSSERLNKDLLWTLGHFTQDFLQILINIFFLYNLQYVQPLKML